MVDCDGRFRFVNRAWCEALGWSRGEALSLGYADVVHPDRLPHCQTLFAELARGRTFDGVEIRFVTKAGRELVLEGRIAGCLDGDGRFTHTLGFFRDVTRRRQEEAVLAGRANILRGIAGGAALAETLAAMVRLLETHCDGAVGAMHFVRRSEYSDGPLIGPNLHPEYRALIEAGDECPCLHAAGQEVGRIHVSSPGEAAKAPGGHRLAALALARGIRCCWSSPIVDRQGRPHGTLVAYLTRPAQPDALQSGLFEFITQTAAIAIARHLEERSLRKSESRFRTLIAAIPVAVLEVSADGAIRFANAQAERIFGRSGDELQGMSVDALIPEPVSPGHPSRSAGGPPDRLALRRGGDPVPVELGRTPVEVGGETGTLVSITDLTERRQAERERRQLEEQLRQSTKMEAVGTLAGGIAHDFNNILGAILGNAQLAAFDLPADHPAGICVAEIEQAARRARGMVGQILTFSRQQPQEQQPLELAPVVEEAARLLRATIPAGVEVAVELAAPQAIVLGDSTQLHQVLINLGTNGWHTLDGWPGKLSLRLGEENLGEGGRLPAGRYVTLTVADTGKGMSKATQDRIFDPFFTTKPLGSGTGLGLSVVHGIVKQHGGVIEVRSELGKGSEFTVWLPRSEKPATVAGPEPEVGARPCCRVLVLDDVEALALATTRLLRRLGYQAESAHRPEVALDTLKRNPEGFDLVITDYNMPNQSGIEFAERVRDQFPRLPVLLMSGVVSEDLRAEAEAAGVCEVVQKPIEVTQLDQAVRNWGRRRAG